MGVMSLPIENSSCILQRMRMKYPVLLLQLVCILVIRGVQLLQLRLVGIRTRVRGAQLLCIICVIDYNKHNNILASMHILSSIIILCIQHTYTTFMNTIIEQYYQLLWTYMHIISTSLVCVHTKQLWIVLEYSQSTLLKFKCVKHTAHELVYHGTFDSCAAFVRYVYTSCLFKHTQHDVCIYQLVVLCILATSSSIMHTLAYALSFFIHFFMFRFIQQGCVEFKSTNGLCLCI